ncbi:hypothetical protein M0802_001962 [Mischocyttarus mexicanus]|nr:hypothetical protein M0802_001962 [Mischocyttarus mexicanus]
MTMGKTYEMHRCYCKQRNAVPEDIRCWRTIFKMAEPTATLIVTVL